MEPTCAPHRCMMSLAIRMPLGADHKLVGSVSTALPGDTETLRVFRQPTPQKVLTTSLQADCWITSHHANFVRHPVTPPSIQACKHWQVGLRHRIITNMRCQNSLPKQITLLKTSYDMFDDICTNNDFIMLPTDNQGRYQHFASVNLQLKCDNTFRFYPCMAGTEMSAPGENYSLRTKDSYENEHSISLSQN